MESTRVERAPAKTRVSDGRVGSEKTMRIGIHVSIQGGMEAMARRAERLGCETVQVFSRSPRGGKASALDSRDIEKMKEMFDRLGIWPLVVHVPYFLNLASADREKRLASIEILVEDLGRSEALGAKYLVTHLGHLSPGEESESPQAIARVTDSIRSALDAYRGPVKILLENTAGQGREIGWRFEVIGAMLENLPADRVGACLDTCHAFAAGYDLSSARAVDATLKEFDRCIGLSRLGVIHMNDSKGDCGSHVDRHEHIGRGKIGADGFRAILGSPLLPPDIPGILETPQDSAEDDERNVQTLKSLRSQA
ncbi:MAG: deoxyribonuclease IV [Firmicutes bacterium]|nr:deoxyribonuclease IV [Candidatus Fermentithermobacillaceae bacterium]